ncbi:hypothetical protein Bcell_0951 [Evansella cellulosilytica DSM 2522]|uniref:Uncharacterized protein n=1 Tax=Evansella cellulosilytica (strain ATCC 21833 / DSM 2522 / FERM P-1141 / JCM 9156 / N-4) TaxID=649639 RepID=E6U1Y1_EVAC2|nr:hypothetical protein Bcell_0951 [Evansella cellulosilytica DSM 2522]
MKREYRKVDSFQIYNKKGIKDKQGFTTLFYFFDFK